MLVFEDEALGPNELIFKRAPEFYSREEDPNANYLYQPFGCEITFCYAEKEHLAIERAQKRALENEVFEPLQKLRFIEQNIIKPPWVCDPCKTNHFILIGTTPSLEKRNLSFLMPVSRHLMKEDEKVDILEKVRNKEWALLIPLNTKKCENAIEALEKQLAAQNDESDDSSNFSE